MKRLLTLFALIALCSFGTQSGNAQILIGGALNNGNLDTTYQQEIVPGFFLPKPAIWQNVGTRAISGPYEDEMSSEPWAGPAPTPVTVDDWGVFFKPFSGNATDGAATGHLFMDLPGVPGLTYSLTGWAGAEANYLAQSSIFAIDFLGIGGVLLSSSELDLVAAGLFTDNGQAFDYKPFTVTGMAPAGTVTVRARVSMINAMSNPAGGGQAFVVDDFELIIVPEPSALALSTLGVISFLALRRRK